MRPYSFFLLLSIMLLAGCNILKKNTATGIENGDYKIKTPGTSKRIYLVFEDSIARLFPYHKKKFSATGVSVFEFGEIRKSDTSLHLRRSGFDFDVFTIPFKYRPSVANFPNQLNTNFSGAIYIGYRTDNYHFSYGRSPLGYYERKLNHLGYSVGIFSGFGSTAMNPWVTQNGISSEYDGLVFLNGAAGIVAVDNLTFGLGLGVDHLLDKNKNIWIYHGKPWLGLTIGLNLN